MNSLELCSDAPTPPLLVASAVGGYVLHGQRVCSPRYLEEEASQIPDAHERDFQLGEIATAPGVIVWRVRPAVDLPQDQRRRLDKISLGITKETRARQLFVSPRTEARHTAALLDRLNAPTQATAVIIGICAGLLQIEHTTAPKHTWPSEEELGWCRSLGLGETYTTMAPALGTVPQKLAVKFKSVYSKVPANEHPNLMRRLFEANIFQAYRPGQILGDSEITQDE